MPVDSSIETHSVTKDMDVGTGGVRYGGRLPDACVCDTITNLSDQNYHEKALLKCPPLAMSRCF